MYGAPAEAYRNVQKSSASGRELEAAVLAKAALMLKRCQDHWHEASQPKLLDEALGFNQMVWSIFQSELCKPDSPLPKPLRENVLSLAAFIDKRVLEIMADPAPHKLSAIININLHLAAGLRGQL
jgi:flagellar protein FlaF